MQIASLKSTVRGKKGLFVKNAIQHIEQLYWEGITAVFSIFFLVSVSGNHWSKQHFCSEHCTQKSVAENFGCDMIRTRYFWVRSSHATSVQCLPAQKILLLSVESFLLSQNRGCFQRKNFLQDFSSKGFYLQVERKEGKGQFFFFFSNSLETKKPSVENFGSWAKKQLRRAAAAW